MFKALYMYKTYTMPNNMLLHTTYALSLASEVWGGAYFGGLQNLPYRYAVTHIKSLPIRLVPPVPAEGGLLVETVYDTGSGSVCVPQV